MVRKETCAQEHPQIIVITSSNLRLGNAFEFSSMYCQSLHYFKLDYRGLGGMADQHNESFYVVGDHNGSCAMAYNNITSFICQ